MQNQINSIQSNPTYVIKSALFKKNMQSRPQTHILIRHIVVVNSHSSTLIKWSISLCRCWQTVTIRAVNRELINSFSRCLCVFMVTDPQRIVKAFWGPREQCVKCSWEWPLTVQMICEGTLHSSVVFRLVHCTSTHLSSRKLFKFYTWKSAEAPLILCTQLSSVFCSSEGRFEASSLQVFNSIVAFIIK